MSGFWEVTLVVLVCEYRGWLLAAAGRALSPVREMAWGVLPPVVVGCRYL